MYIFFWLLARACSVTGIVLLLIGWYCPGIVFVGAWAVASLLSWLLTPPVQPTHKTAAPSTSMELASDYWEASAQMARAAQYYGSQK